MNNINFMDSVTGSNTRTVEIKEVFKAIKQGVWKTQISEIRNHISNGDIDKAGAVKGRLPAFTVSATFKGSRNKKNPDVSSGILHLDYDKLDDAQAFKARIMELPYTYAAFISPSGNGVKVFVKSDNSLSTHETAFGALKQYYDSTLGFDSDNSVKDISRLCFVSYDKDLYLNENAEVFKYPKNETSSQKDLDWLWDFTSNRKEFVQGNRNNFIHFFACNANRLGKDIYEVSNYAYSYCDSTLPKERIKNTIKSAYKNNVYENGAYAKPAILPKLSPSEELSPYIPEDVYDALPPTLKEASNEFKGRERDVFLTSALCVISGGLHNVYGLYGNEKMFPNLFSFIIAPPASGKGAMKYAKQLGECYHSLLFNQSLEDLKAYKKEKKMFDLKVKRAKTDQAIEALKEPEQPPFKMFFIPGDTSSAMIVRHLKDNDGMGCICETEADTMTNALKQDWGGYSNILRLGLQGEEITRSRFTTLEHSEIKEPKFSIAITGTPNQLDSLITSVQDGLFSRFLFYSFVAKPVWKRTYTSEISRSNKEIFEEYSADLCDKFKSNATQKFIMTKEQGSQLDKGFSDALEHNAAVYNENAAGLVFRLGLMAFKLAMVLSAIRSDEAQLTCSDKDFKTAMCLVKDVYMHHSITLLNRLSKNPDSLNANQTTLLNWIKSKDSVKRAEILAKATPLGIKERTLSEILKRFIKLNLIKKISHGVYAKG